MASILYRNEGETGRAEKYERHCGIPAAERLSNFLARVFESQVAPSVSFFTPETQRHTVSYQLTTAPCHQKPVRTQGVTQKDQAEDQDCLPPKSGNHVGIPAIVKSIPLPNQCRSECTSCYDDHAPKDLVRLSCQHSYCKQCFHHLVLNALQAEEHWPPKCCASPIDHSICLKNIPRALSGVYKRKRQEYSVPINQRYYCPMPDCGLFVPADKINAPFRRARCKAKHVTCMDCAGPAHADATQCPRNRDMELVQRMARQQGWRRCYRCLTMIEHRTACRHIRCRCGAEFCYVCGAKWWTCGCTERQLQDMKERARRNAERRQLQERRQAQERAAWGLDGGDHLGVSGAQQYWFEDGTGLGQSWLPWRPPPYYPFPLV